MYSVKIKVIDTPELLGTKWAVKGKIVFKIEIQTIGTYGKIA